MTLMKISKQQHAIVNRLIQIQGGVVRNWEREMGLC